MFSRQRGMAIKTDINKQGWQKSDFPVACEKCYGQNPYMRMLKQNYGQECRICFRPFTVFKWKGDRGVYKRTCVCSTCSKDKNLCQVCTLDLEFGLPMEIRDKRCGVNGKYLLNENFVNEKSQKVKPPPPNCPPPVPRNVYEEKQAVYIPEQDESQSQKNKNLQKQQLKKDRVDRDQDNPQKQEKQDQEPQKQAQQSGQKPEKQQVKEVGQKKQIILTSRQ